MKTIIKKNASTLKPRTLRSMLGTKLLCRGACLLVLTAVLELRTANAQSYQSQSGEDTTSPQTFEFVPDFPLPEGVNGFSATLEGSDLNSDNVIDGVHGEIISFSATADLTSGTVQWEFPSDINAQTYTSI